MYETTVLTDAARTGAVYRSVASSSPDAWVDVACIDGAFRFTGLPLVAAVDALETALGDRPAASDPVVVDVAAVLRILAQRPETLTCVEVAHRGRSGTRRWRPPVPVPCAELLATVVDGTAVLPSPGDWCTVAFATLAAAATDLFTGDDDAANAAVRAGLRAPDRVLALLPAVPRQVAAAALGMGQRGAGQRPVVDQTVTEVAALAALCPAPAVDRARAALDELLDPATARAVTAWIADLPDRGGRERYKR